MKCLTKGCKNGSDAGIFIGDLCSPCHEMITTGNIHHANPTFIGDLFRRVKRLEFELTSTGKVS